MVLRESRSLPDTGAQQHHFRFLPDATGETVGAVLLRVHGPRVLTFWDGAHPTWSDPGAYISVLRGNDEYVIARGNHGWSSEWISMTPDVVRRYLTLCLPFHSTGAGEDCILSDSGIPLRSLLAKGIDRSRSSDFHRYVLRRVAAAT